MESSFRVMVKGTNGTRIADERSQHEKCLGVGLCWYNISTAVSSFYSATSANLTCMYGHTSSKSMDQPGKVASPARSAEQEK